jgi:hypothetical protein
MKSLSVKEEMKVPVIRSFSIEGKHFEVSVCEQTAGTWHWLITAPGEIVLSGDAASEMQAMESACRAGKALARLVAA